MGCGSCRGILPSCCVCTGIIVCHGSCATLAAPSIVLPDALQLPSCCYSIPYPTLVPQIACQLHKLSCNFPEHLIEARSGGIPYTIGVGGEEVGARGW